MFRSEKTSKGLPQVSGLVSVGVILTLIFTSLASAKRFGTALEDAQARPPSCIVA